MVPWALEHVKQLSPKLIDFSVGPQQSQLVATVPLQGLACRRSAVRL